jgi:hypothetical protein
MTLTRRRRLTVGSAPSSQAHWLCHECGTFDGPISGVSCDVCEAQRLEWMIPKRHLHVVRAERDRYRDALQRIIDPGDVRAQLWPRLVAKEALGEAV